MSHSLGKGREKSWSNLHQKKYKQNFSKKGLFGLPARALNHCILTDESHYTYTEQYQVIQESYFCQCLPCFFFFLLQRNKQVSNEAIIRSQAGKKVKRLADNFLEELFYLIALNYYYNISFAEPTSLFQSIPMQFSK